MTHPPVFYIGDGHSGGINIGYYPQEVVIANGVPSADAYRLCAEFEALIMEAQTLGSAPRREDQPER